MKMTFDEKTNTYQLAQDSGDNVAEMESGMSNTLDKITNMEVAGIPLGAAAVGGVTAIVLDRLILERFDPEHKYGPLVLLGMAFAMDKWGKKFLGKAATASALILTYEAIADYISLGIDKVWPKPAPAPVTRSVVSQAQAVAHQAATGGDYYSQAFRR